jgi:acyl carrier protein
MSGEGVLSNSARPRLADADTISRVAEILAMTLSHSALGSRDFEDPELELVADLKADELDLTAIAMDIEERFSLELPDETLFRLRTIGDLHRFVAGGTF